MAYLLQVGGVAVTLRNRPSSPAPLERRYNLLTGADEFQSLDRVKLILEPWQEERIPSLRWLLSLLSE